jgi:hypothetical protein
VGYLGQALFMDRQHGASVAARVLASTPMPPDTGAKLPDPLPLHQIFPRKPGERKGHTAAVGRHDNED